MPITKSAPLSIVTFLKDGMTFGLRTYLFPVRTNNSAPPSGQLIALSSIVLSMPTALSALWP